MSLSLPRLSGLTELLSEPERRFESLVKESLGLDIPPGPASVVLSVQKQFEATTRAPMVRVPRLEPPRLPTLEDLLSRLPMVEPIPHQEEQQVAPRVARILRG